MFRQLRQGVAGTLAVLASLIAIGQAFGPVRRWSGNEADRLYPVGWMVIMSVVIAVLTISLAIAVTLLGRRRRKVQDLKAAVDRAGAERDAATAQASEIEQANSPARRAHDRKILEGIRAVLTRPIIAFLAEWDMGGSWHRNQTQPAHDFVDTFGDVEHRFLDPELEALRAELYAKARELAQSLGKYSFPVRGNPERSDVGVEPFGGDTNQDHLFDLRSEALNEAGTAVAKAYDALIAAAASKLLA